MAKTVTPSIPSTTVTVTVTADHVHAFFALLETGGHPLPHIHPLALALKEQTGLPIHVTVHNLYLGGEEICGEGLAEDVSAFARRVRGILQETGILLRKNESANASALRKLLALVPFSFEFDTMGLGADSDDSDSSDNFTAQFADAHLHLGETNSETGDLFATPQSEDRDGCLQYMRANKASGVWSTHLSRAARHETTEEKWKGAKF